MQEQLHTLGLWQSESESVRLTRNLNLEDFISVENPSSLQRGSSCYLSMGSFSESDELEDLSAVREHDPIGWS